MNSVTVIFWIIIVIYILVGLGLISRIKTMADYYVMGWGATWFWLAGTLLATITSAVTFLGGSGQMYVGNIQNNLPIFSGGLFGTAIATFFAARKLRQLKTMTVPEFWESRYGQSVKIVGTIFMIIQALTYAMIQLIGAGLLLGEILNLNFITVILIFTLTMVVFVVLGGNFGVTITDCLMWITIMLILFISIPIIIGDAGGLNFAFKSIAETAPEYFATDSLIASSGGIISSIVVMTFYFSMLPLFLLRLFPAKDDMELVKAGVVISALMPILFVLTYGGAIVASLAYPGINPPDNVYVHVFLNVIGGPIGGLCMAGLMAAMMSTVSSTFVVIGFGLAKDLYFDFIRPTFKLPVLDDKKHFAISRLVMIFVAILVFILTITQPSAIMTLYTWGTAVIAFSIGVMSLGGLIWKGATKAGALASQIVGFVIFLIYTYGGVSLPLNLSPAFIAVIGSIAAFIVVSLLTKPTNQEIAMYEKTKSINASKIIIDEAASDSSSWNILLQKYKKASLLTITSLVVVIVFFAYFLIETAVW